MPETIRKFLNNFLNNRKAKIKINRHTGKPFNTNAGVRQGSALSPTLYTVYKADTPQTSHRCINLQYADDIKQMITYLGKSTTCHLQIKTRTELQIKKVYFHIKKLTFK